MPLISTSCEEMISSMMPPISPRRASTPAALIPAYVASFDAISNSSY